MKLDLILAHAILDGKNISLSSNLANMQAKRKRGRRNFWFFRAFAWACESLGYGVPFGVKKREECLFRTSLEKQKMQSSSLDSPRMGLVQSKHLASTCKNIGVSYKRDFIHMLV